MHNACLGVAPVRGDDHQVLSSIKPSGAHVSDWRDDFVSFHHAREGAED